MVNHSPRSTQTEAMPDGRCNSGRERSWKPMHSEDEEAAEYVREHIWFCAAGPEHTPDHPEGTENGIGTCEDCANDIWVGYS